MPTSSSPAPTAGRPELAKQYWDGWSVAPPRAIPRMPTSECTKGDIRTRRWKSPTRSG